MDQQATTPKKLSDLIKPYERPLQNKKRGSERGELLEYFLGRVNMERDGKKYKKVKIGYIASKLAHIPTADLYYLRSTCDDSAKRGYSWSKCFFGSLKVK